MTQPTLGRSARQTRDHSVGRPRAVPEPRLSRHQRRPDRRLGRGVQADRLQALRRQAGTAAGDRERRVGQHGHAVSRPDRASWPTRTTSKPTSPRWPASTCGRCWRNRLFSCAGSLSAKPTGCPPSRSSTTSRHRRGRWAHSPIASAYCTTEVSCRHLNPPLPQSISHFSWWAGASTRRCSVEGRRCSRGWTSTVTSAPRWHCSSPATALR